MKLILTAAQIAADPAAWHQARQGGIGASDIASIMGLDGAFGSPMSVFLSKRNGRDTADSTRMRLGRHLEPLVLEMFAEREPGLRVREAGMFAADSRPWQFATFDALAFEPGDDLLDDHALAPVQAKTSGTLDGYGDDGSADVPDAYFAQVQWELDVAGRDLGFLPVLFLPGGELRVYQIERDQSDIEKMRDAARTFLQRVADDDPPPADAHPATGRALRRHFPQLDRGAEVTIPAELARRFAVTKERADIWDERSRLAQHQLLARMGTAQYAVTRDGERVATRSVAPNRRVSVRLLRTRYPDVAAECTIDKPDPIVRLLRPRDAKED